MKTPQYGLLALLAIFALRLGIGFHFFSEGLTKVRDPKPFSSYFLLAAKGPYAADFREMVWDPDGLTRLGYVPSKDGAFPTIDLESAATNEHWTEYGDEIAEHYGFDKKQKSQRDEVLENYAQTLEQFKKDSGAELVEYFQGVERRNENWEKIAGKKLTATLWGQAQEWENEVISKRIPLVQQIDSMWGLLETDLNAIANKKQVKKGEFALEKMGRRPMDSEGIDRFIPWFDCSIGVLLILGLLTRITSVVAAGFLASVIVTQWPGAMGAAPTWPQLIEMLGLLTLAAVGAGRIGGLDYLIRSCCRRKKRRQEQSE
jgi:uncharacterized membrane protein YphA (DoxX/SURF4 family)